MQFQPKTAIRCRDKIELNVTLQMLEKADIRWFGDTKATEEDWLHHHDCELFIYICPSTQYCPRIHLEWDKAHNALDDGNCPGWTYVEASNIFRNQIISERRRNASG